MKLSKTRPGQLNVVPAKDHIELSLSGVLDLM
jgi:hypothetical protein